MHTHDNQLSVHEQRKCFISFLVRIKTRLTYVHTLMHVHTYSLIHTHIYTYVCVSVCIYVCEYACVFACIHLLVSLLKDDRRRSDLIWSRLSLRNLLARTEGRVEYWILHTTWPPLYLIFRGNYSPTDLAKWNPFEAKTGRNLEINLQLAL